jgi:hypothetical protein
LILNLLKEFQSPHSLAGGLYFNPFFLFVGTLLINEKICQSVAQLVFRTCLRTPKRTQNIKCTVPAFFRKRFIEKDGGLRTPNPSAEEARGLEVFLY